MTNSQKHALRLSELRERLNEIGGLEGDAYSDEIRAEETKLQTEHRDTERRYRSALLAEDAETRQAAAEFGDDAKLRELEARASLGGIFDAVVNGRSPDGAEKELQDHHGIGENQVPLSLIAPPPETRAAVETRAVTPAPGDTGATQAPILPAVFPGSVAAFLGVDMPSVSVGDAVYPVLTSRATVGGPHKDSAEVAETTGSFEASVLAPERLQASFLYRRTDAARFAGMSEALRMNLNDALSDALDAQVIAGSNGLLGAGVLTDNAAAAVADFAAYRSMVYSRIDGRFASVVADVRAVMGSAVYAHAAGVYRSNNADDSALDSLMRVSGGVRVSAHVPAVAAKKQNAILRRGLRRDMVAPLWQGVTLIRDEVTQAKKGEITLTAILLHAVKLLRSDGYFKQAVQIAA